MKNLEAYLTTCERAAKDGFSALNNGPQLCGIVHKLVGIIRRLKVGLVSHGEGTKCTGFIMLRTIEAELAGETARERLEAYYICMNPGTPRALIRAALDAGDQKTIEAIAEELP